MIVSQKKNLVSSGTFIQLIYVKILVSLFEELFHERGSNGKFLAWNWGTGSARNKAELSRRELNASPELGKLKNQWFLIAVGKQKGRELCTL